MQVAGMVVTAVLGIAVIAEGAYIVRTRTQLASLTERIENLSSGDERGLGAPDLGEARDDGSRGDNGAESGAGWQAAAKRLPRFVPQAQAPTSTGSGGSADPLPLPDTITSPQAREQLRQFIMAQLEREREERRVREEERQQQRVVERRDRMAKQLSLSAAESEKFSKVLSQADAARASLREKIDSGQVDRAAVRQQMGALRTESEKSMRDLLGDDRMQKFEQLRREEGGPPDWGGGRGFGRGGGRGGPGGGPPGQGAGPGAPPPAR